MAPDHALDETLMGEVVEAAVFAVSLAGSVDEGKVFWRAGRARRFSAGASRATPLRLGAVAPEKSLLERKRDLFSKSDADETAGRNGIVVADEPHRLRGAPVIPTSYYIRDRGDQPERGNRPDRLQ